MRWLTGSQCNYVTVEGDQYSTSSSSSNSSSSGIFICM